MFSFTFIILHYITMKDTEECIESILQTIKYANFNIIVIDNGSPNDSGKLLYQKFKNHSQVDVILLEENLGFAKGNNFGYLVAKYVYDSDFIIFINNDTIIRQQDFIESIIEKFNLEQFDILGPDIISLVDGSHQNPVRLKGISKKELSAWRRYVSLLLLLNHLGFEKILRRVKRKTIGKRVMQETPHDKDLRNVQLHGSCMVFSPKYVSTFDGICSDTFMYMEEDILHYQAQSQGLLSIYTPDAVVYHKEDSSTNATFDDEYKRRRFQYKNVLASSRVLLGMMNGGPKDKNWKSD